jgi:hypothetical protein
MLESGIKMFNLKATKTPLNPALIYSVNFQSSDHTMFNFNHDSEFGHVATFRNIFKVGPLGERILTNYINCHTNNGKPQFFIRTDVIGIDTQIIKHEFNDFVYYENVNVKEIIKLSSFSNLNLADKGAFILIFFQLKLDCLVSAQKFHLTQSHS